MPLALTCDCGARFDPDDVLAGQELPCPECGEPVRAPDRPAAPRTSLWALAALVLALIGLLTPVGALAAVFVGLWALNVIRQRPGQLAGSGLALAAVGVGLVSSVVSAGLFLKPDLLPVSSWFRQRALAGQIDTSGALETISRSGDVLIDRPSRDWGRARRDRTDDPVMGELQQKVDLLLVNVKRNAYVDVTRDANNGALPLDRYKDEILTQELNPYRQPLLGEDDGGGGGFGRARQPNWVGGAPPSEGPFRPVFMTSRQLDAVDGHNVKEWQVMLPRAGQKWQFLIRVYRKANARQGDPVFVVRAYTPAARFKANEPELTQILDTVRIPQ